MSAMVNLDEEELLTTGDAARLIGLSPESIRRLSNEGKLTAIRTRTGQRLFRKSDLEALVRKRASMPYRFGRPQKPVHSPEDKER